MLFVGYKQSQRDYTLFIKHLELGGVTTIMAYVDDIIITRNDEGEKMVLKQSLTKEFRLKSLTY